VNGIGKRFSVTRRALITFLLVALPLGVGSAAELRDLKVLYLGNTNSSRAADYKAFLGTNVARVDVAERDGFKPALADAYDVVLLEWPQSGGGAFPPKTSPLGPRDAWTKPTVLLGSAGLRIATLWDVKGGFG
jgi:hypothetical protein